MVGIIILNYNAAGDTINCIASIEKYTTVAYRIYIVDGASKDDSFERLGQHYAGHAQVVVIQAAANRGYSAGNNVGITRAMQEGATSVCIINPDVTLLNNAIDRMQAALDKEEEVAMVGPRILGPDTSEMHFAAKPLTFASFCMNRKPLIHCFKKRAQDLRFYKVDPLAANKFSGSVSGCCFMMRAADFGAIGLFDTAVFMYHEEDIIAYKLQQLQQLTMIVLEAQVLHHHSSTASKEGKAFIRYYKSISAYYVLRQYATINWLQSVMAALLILLPFVSLAMVQKEYRLYALPLVKHVLKNDYNDVMV